MVLSEVVDKQDLKFYLDKPVFVELAGRGFKIVDVYTHSVKTDSGTELFYTVILTYDKYELRKELEVLFKVLNRVEIANLPAGRPKPRVGQVMIKIPFEAV